MRSVVGPALLAAALVWSRPAAASIITIDPDDVAAGTNLTAATPGVLLWSAHITGSADDPLSLSAVYARHDAGCDDSDPLTGCYAFTGSQGFSPLSNPEGSLQNNWNSDRNPANCFSALHDPTWEANSCGPGWAGFTGLLVEFTAPTTYAEIAGVWALDYLELRAFDENFNRLALPQVLTSTHHTPGGNEGTLSVTSPTANLSYIFFGSTEGGIALDRLRVEQIPEPSTFMLTMLGLVGLRRARRNRRKGIRGAVVVQT